MCKKFEINRTKIKGGCQSGSKVVTHNSKSDLPLVPNTIQRLILKRISMIFKEFANKAYLVCDWSVLSAISGQNSCSDYFEIVHPFTKDLISAENGAELSHALLLLCP